MTEKNQPLFHFSTSMMEEKEGTDCTQKHTKNNFASGVHDYFTGGVRK